MYKKMPYEIKRKIRQYANITNKARNIQRELMNEIEKYDVPVDSLIGCEGNPYDTNEKVQTDALAFLNNGECDNVEEAIEDIEKIFLYYANKDSN